MLQKRREQYLQFFGNYFKKLKFSLCREPFRKVHISWREVQITSPTTHCLANNEWEVDGSLVFVVRNWMQWYRDVGISLFVASKGSSSQSFGSLWAANQQLCLWGNPLVLLPQAQQDLSLESHYKVLVFWHIGQLATFKKYPITSTIGNWKARCTFLQFEN